MTHEHEENCLCYCKTHPPQHYVAYLGLQCLRVRSFDKQLQKAVEERSFYRKLQLQCLALAIKSIKEERESPYLWYKCQ